MQKKPKVKEEKDVKVTKEEKAAAAAEKAAAAAEKKGRGPDGQPAKYKPRNPQSRGDLLLAAAGNFWYPPRSAHTSHTT